MAGGRLLLPRTIIQYYTRTIGADRPNNRIGGNTEDSAPAVTSYRPPCWSRDTVTWRRRALRVNTRLAYWTEGLCVHTILIREHSETDSLLSSARRQRTEKQWTNETSKIQISGWPHFRGKTQRLFRDFSCTGLSATFSMPIPAMFYHVIECLWHRMKTINNTYVALLTAVT